MDPTYFYAHYNLACSGALLLEKILLEGKENLLTMEELIKDKYSYIKYLPYSLLNEIFNHLAISIFLNSKYIEKSQNDSDLVILHSMERFKSFISFCSDQDYWPYYGFFKRKNYSTYQIGEMSYFMILLDGRMVNNARFNNNNSYIFGDYDPFGDEEHINTGNKLLSFSNNPYILNWEDLLINDFGYLPCDSIYGDREQYISKIKQSIIITYLNADGHKEVYENLWLCTNEYKLLTVDNKNLKLSSELLIGRINSETFIKTTY